MHLNSENLILFEGTNSKFKLAVNGIFNKSKQDGSTSPLITVSQQGNVTLRPSIFLVFTYMTDDFSTSKSVYTSNPHLLKIRNILSEIKELIFNNEAFTTIEGVAVVNPQYANVERWTLANIGKKSGYLSFFLSTEWLVDTQNNRIPSVCLEISGSPEPCVFTIDEFLTIYQIIMDVNLSTCALNMANTELLYSVLTGNQNSVQQQNNNYGNRNYAPQTQYNRQPGNYQNNNQYGNNVNRQATYQVPTSNQPRQATAQRPVNIPTPAVKQVTPTFTTKEQPKQDDYNFMKPRNENKPMIGINVNDIDIPEEDLDFGGEGIADIFGDAE